MANKRIEIELPGKLRIEVDEEAEATVEEQKGAAAPPVEAGGGQGVLEGAKRTPYLRREDSGITLFNLGTRLRSVAQNLSVADYTRSRPMGATESPEEIEGGYNEWVEINLDGKGESFASLDPDNIANAGTLGFNADLPPAMQAAFDRELLGSRAPDATDTLDPLGYTPANGSKRKLPHCMPLPYKSFDADKSGSILVDVILTKPGKVETLPASEIDRESARNIGNPPGSPYPKLSSERWTPRKPGAKDELELWNKVNLDGGEALEDGGFDMQGIGGLYSLKVDSRLYFEPFDTADVTNFKVTKEPTYGAERVDFRLNASKAARLFLKPQYVILCPHRAYSSPLARFSWETWYIDYQALSNYNPNIPFRSRVGFTFRQTGASWEFTGQSGGYGLEVTVGWDFHPNMKRGDYTINGILAANVITLRASGAASGAGSNTIVQNSLYGRILVYNNAPNIVPGINANGIALIMPGESASGQATITPAWANEQALVGGASASLTTATAGIMPAYGRLRFSDWATLYHLQGSNKAGREYAVGTQLSFSSGFDNYTAQIQSFKRRPLWNSQEVAKTVAKGSSITPMSYYSKVLGDAAAGVKCEVSESAGRQPPAITAMPFNDRELFRAEARRIADSLRTCIASKAWHREVTPVVYEVTPGGDTFSDGALYESSLSIIPARTAPAGRLCAIIEHDKRIYYVWGATVVDRTAPDYLRDQASGLI